VASGATGAPRVVALGGGHGLSRVLRAVRGYAGDITAIVTVADDGGSSGRLRRELGVPAPGDLRECLVALAGETNGPWPRAFQHRFTGGELDGHALGNLVLVALAEATGDWLSALREAGRLLDAVGTVLPATADPVVLKAVVAGEAVQGEVAVSRSVGRIQRVELVPADARPGPEAVDALLRADQVVLAPGSLYTSLLPVLCVHDLRDALDQTGAQVVYVCNLRTQVPETAGLDGTDHVAALRAHGARVDTVLYQNPGTLAVDEARVRSWGTRAIGAEVAVAGGGAHDPPKLARALVDLLESDGRGRKGNTR